MTDPPTPHAVRSASALDSPTKADRRNHALRATQRNKRRDPRLRTSNVMRERPHERDLHPTPCPPSCQVLRVAIISFVFPKITGLYVHIDLDVLDSAVAQANIYAAPDGLDADQLDELLGALLRTFPVRAVSLTAYDPAYDVDSRVPPIALRLLGTIARNL
jgi:Arginase family